MTHSTVYTNYLVCLCSLYSYLELAEKLETEKGISDDLYLQNSEWIYALQSSMSLY